MFLGIPTIGAVIYIGYTFQQGTIESHESYARDVINQYKAIREYYTTNVVKRVLNGGHMVATQNYREDPNAIPIPATFIHELNELIDKNSEVSTKIRLFSQLPFPERKDRELDDFEREALSLFVSGKADFLGRVETIGDERFFRYARPDKMIDSSCVHCHNSVADSPKTDWKLGDTRGALEVFIPIGQRIKASEAISLKVAHFTSILIFGLVMAITFILTRWVKRPLDKMGAMMTAVTQSEDLSEKLEIDNYDELGLLGLRFNEMVERLHDMKVALEHEKDVANEANKAKSRFLSAMSHDIRTPMNAILGITDVMEDTELSAEQKKYLNIIKNAGDALLALINGILDLSKIEAGQLELENVAFDLGELVTANSQMFAVAAKQKGLNLVVNIAGSLPLKRMGDPHRLRQILINLIGNAIKFTSKGSITIMVMEDRSSGNNKQTLLFRIVDTGIGIDSEKFNSIFDEYKQGGSAISRVYGGTGLGLGICKSLVELMGGKIWVESEINSGSTFSFTLPLPEAPTQEKSQQYSGATSQLSQHGGQAAGDSPDQLGQGAERSGLSKIDQPAVQRVLLADDNEDNRLIVRSFLKDYTIQFVEVSNGQEAVEMFKKSHFDLVLMDMQMPIVSGYDAIEEIREWEIANQRPRTLIFALTGLALAAEIRECFDCGCDNVLTKPVRKQVLLEAVSFPLKLSASKTRLAS